MALGRCGTVVSKCYPYIKGIILLQPKLFYGRPGSLYQRYLFLKLYFLKFALNVGANGKNVISHYFMIRSEVERNGTWTSFLVLFIANCTTVWALVCLCMCGGGGDAEVKLSQLIGLWHARSPLQMT